VTAHVESVLGDTDAERKRRAYQLEWQHLEFTIQQLEQGESEAVAGWAIGAVLT
jgi:hypothetical protein